MVKTHSKSHELKNAHFAIKITTTTLSTTTTTTTESTTKQDDRKKCFFHGILVNMPEGKTTATADLFYQHCLFAITRPQDGDLTQ